MAFTPIDPNIIKVGDPLTKELFDIIKDNFNDLDARANAAETTGGSVFIFNGDVSLSNFSPNDPSIFHFKATQDFSISEFRVQLFSKGSIASGILSLDIQKSINTNNANFNTVLTSVLSFNFASDASYSEKVASINSSLNDIVPGEVLRVIVTSVPSGFSGKFLLTIGAE